MPADPTMLREPAELRYAAELAALAAADAGPKPPGWKLSPRAVRTFILGGDFATKPAKGKKPAAGVERKFHGEEAMIDRCIVTLMSNRGLLLVGEPGTAKSMLSELLAAAVSGNSSLTVQGTAGTAEEHFRYGWNYSLLIAKGPHPEALVPSPVLQAMRRGAIARVEEI
ncbi:MAG TPA: AAA family ATPase, partial [Urbifossiella sp.]|nr:AAA family ATPase [Urbifossiella sp.]